MIVKIFPSIKKISGTMEKVINYLFSVLVLYRTKVVQGRNLYRHYLRLKRSRKTIVLGTVESHSPSRNTFCGDQSAGLSSTDDMLSNR